MERRKKLIVTIAGPSGGRKKNNHTVINYAYHIRRLDCNHTVFAFFINYNYYYIYIVSLIKQKSNHALRTYLNNLGSYLYNMYKWRRIIEKMVLQMKANKELIAIGDISKERNTHKWDKERERVRFVLFSMRPCLESENERENQSWGMRKKEIENYTTDMGTQRKRNYREQATRSVYSQHFCASCVWWNRVSHRHMIMEREIKRNTKNCNKNIRRASHRFFSFFRWNAANASEANIKNGSHQQSWLILILRSPKLH